jgi:23S rRNA pseudouridine2605 synthase
MAETRKSKPAAPKAKHALKSETASKKTAAASKKTAAANKETAAKPKKLAAKVAAAPKKAKASAKETIAKPRKSKAKAEAIVESPTNTGIVIEEILSPTEKKSKVPAAKHKVPVAKSKVPVVKESRGDFSRKAEEAELAEKEEREPEEIEAVEEAGKAEPRPEQLERLQKILSQSGIASRRHAEEMIVAGRVEVNGQVVTQLGSKADPARDHIRVDGKLLHGIERRRYFMLNKPKGYVTTVSDPEGRPTVMGFFAKTSERLYPVGRLDFLSEGLLLVTNDGELANLLTKAGSGVEKTYLVKVAGQPSEEQMERLRAGVEIEREEAGSERVRTSPARIRQIRAGDNPWFEVVLIEGRNRELRKMFAAIGHFAEKIRRVGYGPLELDVEPGQVRELTLDEVEALRLTAEGKIKPRKIHSDLMLHKEAGLAAGQQKRFAGPRGRSDRFAGRREAERGSFRSSEDRPQKEWRPRPAGESRERGSFPRGPRPAFQREDGPKKPFGQAAEFRPQRSGFSKPGFDKRPGLGAGRGGGFGARPKFDKPFDKPKFGGPKFDRPRADKPFDREGSGKPRFDKPKFDRPKFDRPGFGKPKFDRPRREGAGAGFGERKPFAPRGERPAFNRGDKPSFGRGEKPAFARRERTDFSRGERPNFSRGDRPAFPRGEKPGFDRGDRPKKNFGPGSSFSRNDRPAFPRGEKPGFDRGDRPKKSFGAGGEFRPKKSGFSKPGFGAGRGGPKGGSRFGGKKFGGPKSRG